MVLNQFESLTNRKVINYYSRPSRHSSNFIVKEKDVMICVYFNQIREGDQRFKSEQAKRIALDKIPISTVNSGSLENSCLLEMERILFVNPDEPDFSFTYKLCFDKDIRSSIIKNR